MVTPYKFTLSRLITFFLLKLDDCIKMATAPTQLIRCGCKHLKTRSKHQHFNLHSSSTASIQQKNVSLSFQRYKNCVIKKNPITDWIFSITSHWTETNKKHSFSP